MNKASYSLIFFWICVVGTIQGQCSFTVDAGPDMKVCNPGDMVTINGKVIGSVQEIHWDPATGLSNPKSPVTKATVSGPIEYILTAKGTSNINLITNGNFEAGKTGYSTDYIVGSTPCYGAGYLDCEGTYDVINNPQLGHSAWAPCGDHTSGSGLMMVLNGSAAFQNIWCQTINVMPDMDYVFTAWVTSVISSSPPILQFSINGTSIGPVFTSSGVPCQWEKYEVIWNSGSSTTADICILNENTATGGNDFAIDDLSFKKICEIRDTMKIEVEEIIVAIEGPDIVTCDKPRAKIDASGSSSGKGWTAQWTTSDGKIISGGNTLQPLIEGPGTYMLTICSPLPNCCKTGFVVVEGNIKPPDLSLIVKDTIGCNTASASIISRSRVSPLNYEWSGPNGFNSNDPFVVVTSGGMYYLTITDEYNCKTIDSARVIERSDNPKISIRSNAITCQSDTARLYGSSSIPGSSFEWFGPNSLNIKADSLITIDSGQYVLKVVTPQGCIKFDTVRIKKDQTKPVLGYTADTLSCLKDSSLIRISSNSRLIQADLGGMQPGKKLDTLLFSVRNAGTYLFIATAENACSDSLLIHIETDTATPFIVLPADSLDCNKTDALLISGKTDPGVRLNWTGPAGFTANGDSVVVKNSGSYTLIATGTNGCKSISQIYIPIDTVHPHLQVLPDTLNCLRTKIQLSLTDDQLSKYRWTGPSGFSSNLKNPDAVVPGVYTVVAELNNGCASTLQVNISIDTMKPRIQYRDDTLNCKRDSLVLSATADQSGARFSWNGPNGFGSLVQNPVVRQAGLYKLVVENSNSCKDSVTVRIEQDFRKPDLITQNDTLDCLKRNAQLLARSGRDSLSYLWTGPAGFTSTDSLIRVSQSGVYTVKIESPEGCATIAQVLVVEDTVRPSILLQTDTLDCLKTSLQLQYQSGSSLTSFLWSGPGGFTSSKPQPQISSGGLYQLVVTAPNNCTSESSIQIVQDTLHPILQGSSDTINCRQRTINLSVSVSPPGLIGEWTFPGGQKRTANSLNVNEGGTYGFEVKGQNNCISTLNLFVPVDTVQPDLSVAGDTINCKKASILLTSVSNTKGVQFQWTAPDGSNSATRDLLATKPGTYHIRVSAVNGCEQERTVLVGIDTLRPSVQTTADSIDCKHASAQLIAQSNISNALYQWLDPAGQLLSNQAIWNVQSGGSYQVRVENPSNGCVNFKDQFVKEDSLLIQDVLIEPSNPVCDLISGSLQLLKVIGGHSGLKYSLDNRQSFTTNTTFTGLLPGNYTLFVADDKDCEFKKDFDIVKLPPIQISIQPEVTVKLGDSARLEPDIFPDLSIVRSIKWNPDLYLSCTDCLNPYANPWVEEEYEVTVTDTNGCVSVARVRLKVETPEVWVPNVFSPNGDNINDRVYIFGSDARITNILSFQIFNRWGDRVFENSNFRPNDPLQGWSGTFKGEKCEPGVYVYWAEVELINGNKWLLKGDITLIR